MKFFLCLFLFLFLTKEASSSTTIISLSKTDKTDKDFPYVGSLINMNNGTGGSGTVIGDGSFVITARHVITSDGSKKGMLLDSSNFLFIAENKLVSIDEVYGHPFCDLAILKLSEKLSTAAKISQRRSITGIEFYGVGFGKGCKDPKFNSINWDVPYGTKRVYKNTIQSVETYIEFNYGYVQKERNIVFVLKNISTLGQDRGAIQGEGMHGPGDSGGGLFISSYNHENHLIGIISAIGTEPVIFGIATDALNCKEWITQIVPDAFEAQKIEATSSSSVLKHKPSFKVDTYNEYVIPNKRRIRIKKQLA